MLRNEINEINVLVMKSNQYDKILERPTEGLAKPLCFYGTSCTRKNPAHKRDFLHEEITHENIHTRLEVEKSRFLRNFNEMLAVITEKVEIVYAMADSDNIDNAIHDLTQLISRLMPYIKHLFFLEENLIRDLDFDIAAVEEFINTPLMQLQTGDIIGIQAWVHEDAYIPLTKIVTVKNKQREEVIKQMALDKADHEGSFYDGPRSGKKRGRGGEKRTRRKKRIKGGKKKKSKKKLFNKKKRTVKRALRR
jgi:hypothetical protein